MRFDELAARAGRAAADVGRTAERPTFARVRSEQNRRRQVAGWSMAGGAAAAVLVVVLLWPGPALEPQLVGADTTPTTASATTAATVGDEDRESCPVTEPGDSPFTPPSATPDLLPLADDGIWYGTPDLWTMVYREGQIWSGLPVESDGSLTQKTFWWSTDFVSISDPVPEISVTAQSWDEPAVAVESDEITSGGNPEQGVFVIAGLEIPGEGCWTITAEYEQATLGYVVWVGDE